MSIFLWILLGFVGVVVVLSLIYILTGVVSGFIIRSQTREPYRIKTVIDWPLLILRAW